MRAYIISDEQLNKIDIKKTKINNDDYYFIITNIDDIEELSTKFNLFECTEGECLERRHQTGIEVYRHYYFISLNIPKISEGRVQAQQLDIYFGNNFVICSSHDEVKIIDKLEEELLKKQDAVFKGIPNATNKLLYMLFDRLVLKSLGVINELERKVETQEERVLKIGRRNMVNELITLRRQIFKIRSYISSLTYISDMLLLNELEIIHPHTIKYFNNIGIKFSQLNSGISGLYHSITSLREAYEAEISNQLNEIMKVFTIISTIFLPLNLVTGIYGMNFQYIPELNFKYGYFVILGFMACVAGVLIILFRRK